jgi:hypothetical protein
MTGGHEHNPLDAHASRNSMGAIGEQLLYASNNLPFANIAAAMVHAYNAETILHEVNAGPLGDESLLAGAQAQTQAALQRLAGVCQGLSGGKEQLQVYLAACGVSGAEYQGQNTAHYSKILGTLARLPEMRAVAEMAHGFATDIGEWTDRAKKQYPNSLPPADMLGELHAIAGYYGQAAPTPETPDVDTPPDDTPEA